MSATMINKNPFPFGPHWLRRLRRTASAGRARAVLAALVALVTSVQSHGQWALDTATTFVDMDSLATAVCTGACGPIAGPMAFYDPGLNGADLSWFTDSMCKVGVVSSCGCKAHGWALLSVYGLGSGTLRIHAEGYSYVKHRCNFPIAYYAEAIGDINLAALALSIGAVPPGGATVFYRGRGFSFATHDPEAGIDDWTVVGLPPTWVAVDGTDLLPPGGLDLPYTRGALIDNWSGSLTTTDSDVPVSLAGGTWAVISPPPKSNAGAGHNQQYVEWDREYCGFVYDLMLSIGQQIPEDTCPAPSLRFSVDIGSDAEPSDPSPDFNEVFDPFDAYDASGVLIPYPGIDGFPSDDAVMGFDFSPALPTPGFGAPACVGFPLMPATTANLDLDGMDSIDFSLASAIAAMPVGFPGGPPLFPIPAVESPCVHRLEHLLISFEDDTANHFVGSPLSCPIPVGSTSPGGQTYGSSAMDDEVVGVMLVSSPTILEAIMYPVADEEAVHVNLAPNPPAGFGAPQDLDDDVDALDLVDAPAGPGACGTWLFGVDHEARAGFPAVAPGNIMEWSGAGPGFFIAVTGTVHLGLPAGTDIRDFELVRAPSPDMLPGEVYMLLFTVAPDDLLTAAVESGFLDPGMIYGSYFTGTNFPVLPEPFDDAIDALAAWCAPVNLAGDIATPCPADINGDGTVNILDLLALIAAWSATGGPADINGDGIVNILDLLALIAAWGPCV